MKTYVITLTEEAAQRFSAALYSLTRPPSARDPKDSTHAFRWFRTPNNNWAVEVDDQVRLRPGAAAIAQMRDAQDATGLRALIQQYLAEQAEDPVAAMTGLIAEVERPEIRLNAVLTLIPAIRKRTEAQAQSLGWLAEE